MCDENVITKALAKHAETRSELSNAKMAITILEEAKDDIELKLKDTENLLSKAKLLLKAALELTKPTFHKWTHAHVLCEQWVCPSCSQTAGKAGDINHQKGCVYVEATRFLAID